MFDNTTNLHACLSSCECNARQVLSWCRWKKKKIRIKSHNFFSFILPVGILIERVPLRVIILQDIVIRYGCIRAATSGKVPLGMCAQRSFRSGCACAAWSESLLGAFWIAKDANFLQAENKSLMRLHGCSGDLSIRWVHMSEGTFSLIAANRVPWLYISLWGLSYFETGYLVCVCVSCCSIKLVIFHTKTSSYYQTYDSLNHIQTLQNTILPYFSWVFKETSLWKRARPRSDAIERGVWSGSTRLSTRPAVVRHISIR